MMSINGNTRQTKTIEIIIQPVQNMEKDFIAYYKSAMISCTYAVYFKNTIMGALALNSFFDMLKSKYPGRIDFRVEDCGPQFQNPALLDILNPAG
jgi:hypothetical protein